MVFVNLLEQLDQGVLFAYRQIAVEFRLQILCKVYEDLIDEAVALGSDEQAFLPAIQTASLGFYEFSFHQISQQFGHQRALDFDGVGDGGGCDTGIFAGKDENGCLLALQLEMLAVGCKQPDERRVTTSDVIAGVVGKFSKLYFCDCFFHFFPAFLGYYTRCQS